MTLTHARVAAAVLALTAAFVGVWASVAPHAFYVSFPLPSHSWIHELGPYNEHLVRDVGGLYLAICAVTAWSAVVGRADLLRMVGTAWLVFGTPHLVFHLGHLEVFSGFDQVGNAAVLGAGVLLATLLLFTKDPSPRGTTGQQTRPAASEPR